MLNALEFVRTSLGVFRGGRMRGICGEAVLEMFNKNNKMSDQFWGEFDGILM